MPTRFFNPLIVLLKKNKVIKVAFTHALRTKKWKKEKKFISYIKYIKIIKPNENQVKVILNFQKKRRIKVKGKCKQKV